MLCIIENAVIAFPTNVTISVYQVCLRPLFLLASLTNTFASWKVTSVLTAFDQDLPGFAWRQRSSRGSRHNQGGDSSFHRTPPGCRPYPEDT